MDSYNITITTIPISEPISNLTQFTEFSLTVNYNVEYTITLFAMNCAGESSPTTISFEYGEFSLVPLCRYMSYISIIVKCEEPIPPMNGNLSSYPHTREGATVIFQCNDGYTPSTPVASTCTRNASWIPAPEEHNCILVEGICLK